MFPLLIRLSTRWRIALTGCVLLCFRPLTAQTGPPRVQLSGVVRDAAGVPVAGAVVQATRPPAHPEQTVSDAAGGYSLILSQGLTSIDVRSPDQRGVRLSLDLEGDRALDLVVTRGDSVTVRADGDPLTPDPATQGFARAELLDADPGRPGVPLSLPGYPTETASGGLKAPQYFAPGVAGDHGEPIAQFFQLGGFLIQNNLTANAHGNGYADPNFVITPTIGGVVVDNAAYSARYGDHSINLAVTYDLRNRVPGYLQMTSDGRDGAFSAGWSPKDDRKKKWLAAEALFGNGFLRRAEERQQYKLNGLREWQLGRHTVDVYGVGYYGFSRIPGLIPLDTPVLNDTIDQRQADLTHTTLAAVADRWQLSSLKTLSTGLYVRTYSLTLRSNFGDGLIQQSEFRTVVSGNATYAQPLARSWLLLAGLDARRDAPRGLNLAHADAEGAFSLVTSNNLNITNASPFASVSGRPLAWMQVYLGLRRDQFDFNDVDKLTAANSFDTWTGTTSPKLNMTFGRADAMLPQVSFSFGKAFHANDPRIGTGSGRGDLLIQAREFQMFATKDIAGTELRLTLARVANSAELAKIDPDTGLQENVGPSVDRFLTLAVRRRLPRGFFQVSWSEADARDRELGSPIPEAPRMIVDAVGSVNRLPFDLEAKTEYEYLKAKPLGDGFTGVPLQEIRFALNKNFADGRWAVSLNGRLSGGYTGQTLETLAVGSKPAAFEQRVGVPSRSYGSVSVNYFFRR